VNKKDKSEVVARLKAIYPKPSTVGDAHGSVYLHVKSAVLHVHKDRTISTGNLHGCRVQVSNGTAWQGMKGKGWIDRLIEQVAFELRVHEDMGFGIMPVPIIYKTMHTLFDYVRRTNAQVGIILGPRGVSVFIPTPFNNVDDVKAPTLKEATDEFLGRGQEETSS